MALAEAQARFAAAVADPGAAVPAGVLGGASRFAVHRVNAVGGLIDALAGRFPVTCRIVGPDFFRGLARAFVTVHPPRSPVLLAYGDEFPGFIAGFAPAASVPYLADVAGLEVAWSHAYHAPDETPLDPGAILAMPPDRLAASQFALHPSVRVARSRFPILSIWAAHQGDQLGDVGHWDGEDVLISRPQAEIQLHRLAAGTATFLLALSGGATVEAAGGAALSDDPGFDTGRTLAGLIAAEALAGIIAPKSMDQS